MDHDQDNESLTTPLGELPVVKYSNEEAELSPEEEEDYDMYDIDNDLENDLQIEFCGQTLTDEEIDRQFDALIPYVNGNKEEDDEEIDSEEEREILKEIKSEVTNKVRGEMQEELEKYSKQLETIESEEKETKPKIAGTTDKNEQPVEIDPTIKEALMKMRKLDKILNKKIEQEREVKKERLRFERQMKKEISEMNKGGAQFREIAANTERFLSLEPPPKHNAGINLDDLDDDLPPFFQTQIDDSQLRQNRLSSASNDNLNNSTATDRNSKNSEKKESSRAESSVLSHAQGKNKKDFIKRNKELAADADQVVAMTDDEKKRLQELLEGIDETPDAYVDTDDAKALSQTQSHVGEGFWPDSSEYDSLKRINEKLQNILPKHAANAIEDSSMFNSSTNAITDFPQVDSQPLTFRSGTTSQTDTSEKIGEKALFEAKEDRDLQTRLKAIEEELDKFKASKSEETLEQEPLSDEQLEGLLDQCAKYLDFDDDIEFLDTPRSLASSRQLMLENPPRLTEEQLEQLLAQAHFPFSSRLMELRPDEDKISDEIGNTEVIRAETWKTIMNEDLDKYESIEEAESSLLSTGEENISQNAHKNMFENTDNQSKVDNLLSVENLESLQSMKDSKENKRFFSTKFENVNTSGLPNIIGVSRQNSQLEPRSRPNSTNSQESVRLPNINNSFLIYTTQGGSEKTKPAKFSSEEQTKSARHGNRDMTVLSVTEDDFENLSRENTSS